MRKEITFVILAHHHFLRILLNSFSEALVPFEFQGIEHVSKDLGRKGNPKDSVLLFGMMHLLNVAAGANLAATLLQVVYAVAIGLMYAALALRTQTILPLIVTHGLTDFFGFLALNSTIVTTGLSTLVFIVTAGEIIVYTAYSIILLRQMKSQSFGTKMGTTSMPSLAHEEFV